MPRTLSASIQSSLAQQTQRACHLLTFIVGENTYRFAEDLVTHVGNLYLPHLIVESGPKHTEQLQLQPVKVRLQNITLETAQMLKNEGAALQGQEATLERLFPAARETVVLFKGRISNIVVSESDAVLTLAGELDPSAARIPRRKYSALCVWDFKDTNCGYTDGVDPDDPGTGQPFVICPKDLASCQARGRQQRFPGFLSITRDLTEIVEGGAAGVPEQRDWSEVYLD